MESAVERPHNRGPLAAEFGVPAYQNLNSPQMETDRTLTIGWQKTLGDC